MRMKAPSDGDGWDALARIYSYYVGIKLEKAAR